MPIEELLSSNLLELRENADVVFVGELTDSELISGRDGGVLRTRYEFAVETYLKGERTNDRISLRNLGGRSAVTGKTMSTPFSFEFTVGERYLVFLRPGFEELELPIIHAFSIKEGGDALVDPSGRQLVGLNRLARWSLRAKPTTARSTMAPSGPSVWRRRRPPRPRRAPAVARFRSIPPQLREQPSRPPGVTLEDVEQILR